MPMGEVKWRWPHPAARRHNEDSMAERLEKITRGGAWEVLAMY